MQVKVTSGRGPAVVAVAGIITAVSLAVLRCAGAVAPGLDDAFIVLVYARHFASSGRIFWNVEDGPVDGFTSMLDMLLKAALVRLFPSDPFRDAHALVLVTYVASVVLGGVLVHHAAAQRLSRSRAGLVLGLGGSFLAAVCFGVNPALAWAVSFSWRARSTRASRSLRSGCSSSRTGGELRARSRRCSSGAFSRSFVPRGPASSSSR